MKKIKVRIDTRNKMIIVKQGKNEIQYSNGWYENHTIEDCISDFKAWINANRF